MKEINFQYKLRGEWVRIHLSVGHYWPVKSSLLITNVATTSVPDVQLKDITTEEWEAIKRVAKTIMDSNRKEKSYGYRS